MANTGNGNLAGCEVLISSDSHVMEPPNAVKERVSASFRDQAPVFPVLKVGESFQTHPGGSDPNCRIKEMETDGLSAEERARVDALVADKYATNTWLAGPV